MPNFVTNIIDFKGKGAEQAALTLYEDGTFNFGFAPMPEGIKGTRSPANIVTVAEREQEIADWELKDQSYKDMVGRSFSLTQKMSADLIKKYGANNWYDWAVDNWGTKWSGSSGALETPTQCIFDSAWSTPYEAFKKLSVLFPEVEMFVQYADEDFGSNTGTYRIANGELTDENIPNYGVESLDLAYKIMGQPDHQLDYVLEGYEDDKESEERFSKDCEEAYIGWTINKLVEVSYLPDHDFPMFILDYLRVKAEDVENFEFAGEIKRIIDLKLA